MRAFGVDPSGRGSIWSRRLLWGGAIAVTAIMAVDPAGLGAVAPALAAVAEDDGLIDESREDNLADALSALPAETVFPSDPLELPEEDPAADLAPLTMPSELPEAGEASITVDADGEESIGGLPVTVAPVEGERSPSSVDVRVLPTDEAAETGVSGIVLDVVDPDAEAEPGGEVELTVSYADFAGTAGGDWASRLQLVWIPDCDDDARGEPECRLQPLETINDEGAQTVTAVVPVGVVENPIPETPAPVETPSAPTPEPTVGTPAPTESPEGEPTPEPTPERSPSEAPNPIPTPTVSASTVPEAAVWSHSAEFASTITPTAKVAAAATAAAAESTSGGTVAVTSGVASAQGDWSATSLSPTSTWGSAGNTGGFSWSYPLKVPQASAGPSPELSIGYSSAVSDGRVPSANTQSGLLGEGFDLGGSFVERTYVPCSSDEEGGNNVDLSAPDLCWGTENATLSFQGSSVELVKDAATGEWRARQDDGMRIEHLPTGGAAGEYWRVTTVDGVVYTFGQVAAASSAWSVPVYGNHAGEPCYQAAFSASQCTQVWRWMVDTVVDTTGNAMSYTYETEQNHYRPFYGTGNIAYTSGGHLVRIDYGSHPDDGVDVSPARIELRYAPRCITDLANPASWCTTTQTSLTENHWPDTPVDLVCSATSACEVYSPTFFDRVRMLKVVAWAHDGAVYQAVDAWAPVQSFVPQGDGIGLDSATGVMLRLDKLQHVGHGGTRTDITPPAVLFTYTALENRVAAPDLSEGLWRHRLTGIRTESGATISVNYRTECSATSLPSSAATNTKLCFPVKWTVGPVSPVRTDYFHKYVVDTVVESGSTVVAGTDELVTGSLPVVTTYQYTGGAKWVLPTGPLVQEDERTYSEYRGFRTVKTILGTGDDVSATLRTFYRGAGGTITAGSAAAPVTADDDQRAFAGQVFSTVELNGTLKVSETVTVPGDPVVVATSGHDAAFTATRIPAQSTYGFVYAADGATAARRTQSTATFNDDSQVVRVDDRGDLAAAADDICTTTTYAAAANAILAQKNLVALASLTETVSKTCGTTVSRPADVIAASQATFDGNGLLTKSEVLDPVDGVGWQTTSTAVYDTRGRPTQVTDAAGKITKTAYTATAGGFTATTTVTNPLGHAVTTTFDPVLGVPTSTTDANGRVTTGTYDAMGRLLEVRYPQHAGLALPSVKYGYTVRSTGLNAVSTRTLAADGLHQHVSVELFDGLLRPFQTQTESVDTGVERDKTAAERGRLVAHTYYDSAGRIRTATDQWQVDGAVSSTPEAGIPVPPAQTTYAYDGAGRVVDEVFWVGNNSDPANEKYRTTTVYDGAATLVIPPLGSVPTLTTVDARGQTTEVRRYARNPISQAAADTPAEIYADLNPYSTTYTYTPAGQIATLTEPGGAQWSYTYDWGGRQTVADDPDAGVTTTTYDVAGRVATVMNGAGEKLAYSYDALGRTTTVRDDSTSGAVRATWVYDTLQKGLLTSSTRTVGGASYVDRVDAYDAAYRPTRSTTVLPNTTVFAALGTRSFSTDYQYTADGQLSQITYPKVTETVAGGTAATVLGAEKVTTFYDDASLPTWMGGGFGWGVYVAKSQFTPEGRIQAMDLGNTYGAAVTYQYEDGTDRLTRIALERAGIDGTEVDLAYTYDEAGNVTSIFDTPTRSALAVAEEQDRQCFTYDGLIRLSRAWTPGAGSCAQTPSTSLMGGAAPYWDAYSYSGNNNRTKLVSRDESGVATTSVYSYADAGHPHAVTTVASTVGGVTSSTSYGYDGAGQRTSDTVAGVASAYTWDAEGELVGASGDVYTYDADGSRLVRRSGGVTMVYLAGQEVVIGADGDVSVDRYYSFAGSTVAVRTGRGLGGVTSLVADHHGSPVASVPATGNPATTPVGRWYAGPFGGTRGDEAIPGDHRFLGATRDDIGLTLLGARYFDETTGAFISVDPLLDLNDPAQWNAYAYANSNPVTLSDASGLRPDETPAGMVWKGSQGFQAGHAATGLSTSAVGSQSTGGSTWTPRRGGAHNSGSTHTQTVAPPRSRAAYSTLTTEGGGDLLPGIHGALTIAGTIPIIGMLADIIDATICSFEGDWTCVSFSAIGLIPIVGDIAGTALKLGRAGTHIADASAASTRIPEIKPGSAGGPTAGQRFPQSVRDEAFDENPGTCVYCHMDTERPQVDHVIPRSRGGDATLDNAQVACAWCNGSKGARDFPVNPPPGYEGGWPPKWWDLY